MIGFASRTSHWQRLNKKVQPVPVGKLLCFKNSNFPSEFFPGSEIGNTQRVQILKQFIFALMIAQLLFVTTSEHLADIEVSRSISPHIIDCE